MTDLRGAIGFAEKILELARRRTLHRRPTSTPFCSRSSISAWKRTEASGAPPQMVTTRQLAEKVVELYWPHTIPFAGHAAASRYPSRTSPAKRRSCLSIDASASGMRPIRACPRWESRTNAPAALRATRQARRVEADRDAAAAPADYGPVGQRAVHLRLINWAPTDRTSASGCVSVLRQRSSTVRQPCVAPARRRRILRYSSAACCVLSSSGAGPRWSRRSIGSRNRNSKCSCSEQTEHQPEESGLACGRSRRKRCFYCEGLGCQTRRHAQVDHFVPWSRYPDDGLDNFVAADKRCVADKSSSLRRMRTSPLDPPVCAKVHLNTPSSTFSRRRPDGIGTPVGPLVLRAPFIRDFRRMLQSGSGEGSS